MSILIVVFNLNHSIKIRLATFELPHAAISLKVFSRWYDAMANRYPSHCNRGIASKNASL